MQDSTIRLSPDITSAVPLEITTQRGSPSKMITGMVAFDVLCSCVPFERCFIISLLLVASSASLLMAIFHHSSLISLSWRTARVRF